VAILVVGGSVLRTFAAALLIGMVSGIYSTVYVASATLVYMERRAQRTAAGARMTKAG
jgi:preprotein translocase subunit SecF